ncbi:MAG: methionine synthase [Alphaproteobacteria bacterium]|nr:methionine synthase [Alphaproteobacteria bacterium]
MRRSTDRILTTHVGSLPRPPALLEAMRNGKQGSVEYETELSRAVTEVVKKQVDLGIDVVDDGEFSKPGFRIYADQRLSGYEARRMPRVSVWSGSREALAFPEFYEPEMKAQAGALDRLYDQLTCTGPVAYKGQELVARDIRNLKAAAEAAGAAEAFMPSISPADIAGAQKNEYYASDDEFLFAVADAMHEEYKAIADAGIILQIDDPHLTSHYLKNPEMSMAECQVWAEKQVEAINHALRGIPEDRVRYHTCYGINMGPRVHEMDLGDILDIVLKVNAGAYSFEAANPRHEHEWVLWEGSRLPDGKAIIPGVITHSSVVVEHPELIAQRIVRFASLVGRENVIAGGDCGFGTQASATPEVHPTIVWAKFEAMGKGAALATKQLWG